MKHARCNEDVPRAPARMSWRWPATFLLVAAMLPGVASAMPNFAREYSKSCAMCHTVVPQLNRAGGADGEVLPHAGGDARPVRYIRRAE